MNIQKHNTPANDIQLTATDPVEMVNSQQNLISWCEGKIASLAADAEELRQAYEHAVKMRWKYSTLKIHWKKAEKRISYFEKIKAALLSGFHIVPNFPITMFAIKTNAKKPLAGLTTSYRYNHQQEPQNLDIGEGEYRNPFPTQMQIETPVSGGETKMLYKADDWDELEFPFTMAKVKIMEITSYAMGLKIFDQIGILPGHKKEDPVIIGQIINDNKTVSFMIAWHLNTNVL